MGSSGLSIVNALFDVNEAFDTNEARQEFAVDIIENLGFVYEDINSEVCYMLSCCSRKSLLNVTYSHSKAPFSVRSYLKLLQRTSPLFEVRRKFPPLKFQLLLKTPTPQGIRLLAPISRLVLSLWPQQL
jgi:hypothetical protein